MKNLTASKLLLAVSFLGVSQLHVNASHRFPSYEHNSLDVLTGIDAGDYEQIYVRYHGCVWSEFGNGADNDDNGCGGQGDGGGEEGDGSWYMGRTQCYRANAAYSLYGVRVDDKKKRRENACQRRYYINTFFTKNGVEDLGYAVGLANGDDAPSQCTVVGNGEGNDGDENAASYQHGEAMNPESYSYTTYCSRNGKFVTAMFGGSYCTDKSNLELLDTLDTLNNELENVGCLLVHSSGWNNNANDEAQDGDEDEQDENNDNEDEEEEEEENEGNGRERHLEEANDQENQGGLWNLLTYSSVCSTMEYPRGCPDAYGAKKKFDVNARGTKSFWKQFMWLDWLTLVFFAISVILLVLAYCVYKDRRRRSKRSKSTSLTSNKSTRKNSRFGRSNSSKTKNSSEKKQTQSSDTSEGNRDSSNSSHKSKKGLFRGMFTRK
ncbi:MAG: hypothetical protein SGILL_001328 [Bacillariaceae sp.]